MPHDLATAPDDTSPSLPARRLPCESGALFAFGGVAAGVLAKAADESGAWWPGLDWLGDLTSQQAVWVLAVALISIMARTPLAAAVRAAISMLAMCAGYYAFAAAVLHYPVGSDAAIWALVAVSVVPAAAALLRLARTADRWWSAIIVAVAAAACVADDAISRIVIALTEPTTSDFLFTLRPVRAVVDLAAAIVIVLAVPRSWRVRGIAAAAALVLGFALPPLIDEVRSAIGV